MQSLLELFTDTPITSTQLVAFFQRLLETLPSSSAPEPSSKPRPEAVIGELIVDVYWSVEMQVEEHISAAKAALSVDPEMTEKPIDAEARSPSTERKSSDGPNRTVPFVERKRRAEASREILYDFLRQLLVSLRLVDNRNICPDMVLAQAYC
jgi:THO complex subunit 2